MRWVRGSELPDSLKREVKAAFGYRQTVENWQRSQRWTYGHVDEEGNLILTGGAGPMPEGTPTDQQWLEKYAFPITNAGTLARNHKHCTPWKFVQDGRGI